MAPTARRMHDRRLAVQLMPVSPMQARTLKHRSWVAFLVLPPDRLHVAVRGLSDPVGLRLCVLRVAGAGAGRVRRAGELSGRCCSGATMAPVVWNAFLAQRLRARRADGHPERRRVPSGVAALQGAVRLPLSPGRGLRSRGSVHDHRRLPVEALPQSQFRPRQSGALFRSASMPLRSPGSAIHRPRSAR